jgi:hypothetical protein
MSTIEDRLSRVETILTRELPIEEGKLSDIFISSDRARSNPWLNTALQELAQIDAQSFVRQTHETLKPTIMALLNSAKGLDAEAVGRQTGRERNTESFYLNRLCRMGLVEKSKKGRMIEYKISNKGRKKLSEVFPEFGDRESPS